MPWLRPQFWFCVGALTRSFCADCAPRLAHQSTPAALGLQAQQVRLPAAAGKILFAWFVPVSNATSAPAVFVMIGARFDDVAPLASMARARCPVLLVHGADDEMVPFDDIHRLQAAGRPGAVQCLTVPDGHDPSDALVEHLPQVIDFLQRWFTACVTLVAPTQLAARTDSEPLT